jgi:hypothetical protein
VADVGAEDVLELTAAEDQESVEDQTLEAEAGDVIVTPAGTAHGYGRPDDSACAILPWGEAILPRSVAPNARL